VDVAGTFRVPRAAGRRQRAPDAGFTLIEMLIVMVLLGLMTSLTLPAMQRWHDGIQVRAKVTSVVEALRAAGFAAAASRRDLRMDRSSFAVVPASGVPNPSAAAGQVVRLPLPAGWLVRGVQPAAFLANGLCLPGAVDFVAEGGEQVTVQVQGPICAVETVSGPTGQPNR